MINTKALTLILRNDRAEELLGLQAADLLLQVHSNWSFDGSLWALHCLSFHNLEEFIDRLEALGFELGTASEFRDLAILEMGTLIKPCHWLKVVDEVAHFLPHPTGRKP